MTSNDVTSNPIPALPFTGRDIVARERGVSFMEVQRAADALLRQGIKPSVVGIRDQLGGGSPNTLTPMLAHYWEILGKRLQAGPESLEHVPEALARVTELFWRRALEEARARLKGVAEPAAAYPLEDQVVKLSTTVAEARAREGELLTQLSMLSRDRDVLRGERGKLLALLRSTQELLEQQSTRVTILERQRAAEHAASIKPHRKTHARKATRSKKKQSPTPPSSARSRRNTPRRPK
jgi:hypothetical protein